MIDIGQSIKAMGPENEPKATAASTNPKPAAILE